MIFRLERSVYGVDGILGILYDDKLEQCAVVLEHAYTEGNGYKAKLPDGTYTCQRGTHKLHNSIPFETFEVMDVPGHDNILFHQGNYNKDSEGCLLLGASKANQANKEVMITNSKATFSKFMDKLKDIDKFTLIVINL